MKSVRAITIEIERAPGDVFALLSDLAGFPSWLDPSSTYRATVAVSDDPIVAGTTYTDEIQGMRLYGTVFECEPDRLLVFHQATKGDSLAITIRYELHATAKGTQLVRTGIIATRGTLAALHPIVVRTTAKENARMMRVLKSHLEGTPSGN